MRLLLCACLSLTPLAGQLNISLDAYRDRVEAAWTAQILGTLMGFRFEHKVRSVEFVTDLPAQYRSAPVDDDYFYELVALRAFEKHGPGLTLDQLAAQWRENNAGAWGSSEQARLLLARGIAPSLAGHPRHNRLWFTIGPQFSADLYGMIAPGLPNTAAALARRLGRINGYAEGLDGAVFVAGMVSLAFVETDPRVVVEKAAQLVHPSSPYRQCLNQVVEMARGGETAARIAQAVEDRWHIEYPATNNAVANGGLVALSVWFGEADFFKTVNLAFGAGDFTDADCNAANAAAVVGALRGIRALPAPLVARLGDRMEGHAMGGVPVIPPVAESIREQASRIAALGRRVVESAGGRVADGALRATADPAAPQSPELFRLSDLMQYWNGSWRLMGAGFGGAGGGLRGLRGMTYLDGDVLATYPRDEVRGVSIERTVRLSRQPVLSVEAGADAGRTWQLEVYAGNTRVLEKSISGAAAGRHWETLQIPLAAFAGKEVHLRLYQRVLSSERIGGNAYWRNLRLD